jgi:hypothetical protein
LSLTGTKSVTLQIDTIFLRIGGLSSNLYTTDQNTYTFMIPVTVDTGSVITYTSKELSQSTKLSNGAISMLMFDLYLSGNELVNMNGAEWKCLIEFEECC